MHTREAATDPVREFTVLWRRDVTSRLNKEEVGRGDGIEKMREKEKQGLGKKEM
jgi:hypothetical protein